MKIIISESQYKFLVEQSKPKPSKPVDFYFGTRIFRAPNIDIAQKFASKLAIHNFNSNRVDVLKDKTNERWFVGHNDKIYLNQNQYNQNPNKFYADPIEMGLIAL